MIIKQLSEKEEELLIKRSQLTFILKREAISLNNNKYVAEFAVEEYVNQLEDEALYSQWSEHKISIEKEQWVYLYPMHFHISEFEQALLRQADIYLMLKNELPSKSKIVLKYIEKNIGSKFKKLSLKEKIDLFWFTHRIQF